MRRSQDTFAIWEGIKRLATTYSAGDAPLPTLEQCDEMTAVVLREYGHETFSVPARAFYAAELRELIEGQLALRQRHSR